MRHSHVAVGTGRMIMAGYRKENLPPNAWLFMCEGEEILCPCGQRWIETGAGIRYELQEQQESFANAVGS